MRATGAIAVTGLMALVGPGAAANEIAVPSGQSLEFIEVILEAEPAVARFRFLAPEIDDLGFAGVEADFQVLCDEMALPALVAGEVAVARIIISMSAEPVPFGEPAPDVTQFFEVFEPGDGVCIWEYF